MTTGNSFDYIFFDLDGTLTDSLEGITNSYLHAAKRLGLDESEPQIIIAYIGTPLHEYFSRRHTLNEENTGLGVKYYREYYSLKGLYENKVYKGISELLDRLHLSGRTLYLVTGKPYKYAREILKHFDLEKYFIEIYGSDLSNFNKTKEELIKTVLENENIDIHKCVMIGDRKQDIIGARHHNIKSIGVAYGYGSYDELAGSNPDYIVSSVQELSDLLTK